MATAVKRRTRYETFGSAAYDPAYAPRREREPEVRPQVRPRERVRARPRALVREPGRVSVFAVVGFFAVGVAAALLLFCYAQVTVVADSTVRLQKELSVLQQENAKLLTQYELAYDLKAIESDLTATGEMVRPQSGQTMVLDLSEPDSVVSYAQKDAGDTLTDAFAGIRDAAANVLEYFH